MTWEPLSWESQHSLKPLKGVVSFLPISKTKFLILLREFTFGLSCLLKSLVLILQLSSYTRHHLNPFIPRGTAVTIDGQWQINPEHSSSSFLGAQYCTCGRMALFSLAAIASGNTARRPLRASEQERAWGSCALRGQAWKWKLPATLLSTFRLPGSHLMAQPQGRLGMQRHTNPICSGHKQKTEIFTGKALSTVVDF